MRYLALGLVTIISEYFEQNKYCPVARLRSDQAGLNILYSKKKLYQETVSTDMLTGGLQTTLILEAYHKSRTDPPLCQLNNWNPSPIGYRGHKAFKSAPLRPCFMALITYR